MTPEQKQMMLEARADLGDHRMQSLPLAGKKIERWQLNEVTKPVDLGDVKDEIAVWHTALVEDEHAVPIRDDGIGSGGLHRLGPNYRPSSIGPMRTDRGGALFRSDHIASRARGRRGAKSRAAMRSFTQAQYPSRAQIGQARAETLARQTRQTAPNKENLPIPPIGPGKSRIGRSSSVASVTSQMRPPYNPNRLVSEPFWLQAAASKPLNDPKPNAPTSVDVSHSSKEKPDTKKENDKSAPRDQQIGRPTSTVAEGMPKPEQKISTSFRDPAKWSSKGFVQECPEEIPSHYRKVTFPAKEVKTVALKTSERDSEHYSDVYSDPDLSQAPRTQVNQAITHEDNGEDDEDVNDLLAVLQQKGLQISCDSDDDCAGSPIEHSNSPTAELVPQIRQEESVKAVKQNNSSSGEPGTFLFTLNHLGRTWQVYDYHEPSQIAAQVFHEFSITDQAMRDNIRHQIVSRFDRNLKKSRQKNQRQK